MASPRSPCGPADGAPPPMVVSESAPGVQEMGSQVRRPAWNRPIPNGAIESDASASVVGIFAAADESWPRLSEASALAASRVTPRPTQPSPGPMPVESSPRPRENTTNPNRNQNNAAAARQRPARRGGGNGTPFSPMASSSSSSAVQTDMGRQQPDLSNHVGNHNASQEQQHMQPLGGNAVGADHRRVNGGNNGRRGFNNNGHHNGGSSSGSGFGARRNRDYMMNVDSYFRPGGLHQFPRGIRAPFIRGPPPPPVPPAMPFMGPPPPPGLPMVFPEMPPMYYVGPSHPHEAIRGMPFMPPLPVPQLYIPPSLDPLRTALLKQIEYYFSTENLCKDAYLRQNMDEQGWVPVSLIANFKRVAEQTDNLEFIKDTMRFSEVVELQGDWMRRRGDWQTWVLPHPTNNTLGGTSGTRSPAAHNAVSALSNHFQAVRIEGPSHENNLRTASQGSRSATFSDHSEHGSGAAADPCSSSTITGSSSKSSSNAAASQ